MNYICRKDREQTEKNFQFTATQWQVVWYNDWVRETLQCRGEMVVVIVERCCVDTDEPDGNEFGCWCGVYCSAAKGKSR